MPVVKNYWDSILGRAFLPQILGLLLPPQVLAPLSLCCFRTSHTPICINTINIYPSNSQCSSDRSWSHTHRQMDLFSVLFAMNHSPMSYNLPAHPDIPVPVEFANLYDILRTRHVQYQEEQG
ncbi:hypothetical protein B0H19DRAFT_1258397 [Mycena capillaripes]|nr:hypothetical protein B0H19DRAFT_1258397 [Mycena capillaripes]